MSTISKTFLLLSFFIFCFNGTPVGYILFHERLGLLFGDSLFIFTSLLGVLFASIAEDQQTSGHFHFKFCMISNAIIAFYPLYFYVFSKTILPKIMNLILFGVI